MALSTVIRSTIIPAAILTAVACKGDGPVNPSTCDPSCEAAAAKACDKPDFVSVEQNTGLTPKDSTADGKTYTIQFSVKNNCGNGSSPVDAVYALDESGNKIDSLKNLTSNSPYQFVLTAHNTTPGTVRTQTTKLRIDDSKGTATHDVHTRVSNDQIVKGTIQVLNAFDGKPMRGVTTWRVGDSTFTSDANGVINVKLKPGMYQTHLATNPNAKPAHSVEVVPGSLEMLPRYAGIPQQVQFQRRSIDTLDFKKDFSTIMYMQDKDEAAFNDRHFASFFDRASIGWRVATEDTLHLHTRSTTYILNGIPFLQNATPAVVSNWASVKNFMADALKDSYKFKLTETPEVVTLTSTPAKKVFFLGQSDNNGSFTVPASTGQTGQVAFVDITAPLPVYGAELLSGIVDNYFDNDCWVGMPAHPSNDCPTIPSSYGLDTPAFRAETVNTLKYFGKSASRRTMADVAVGSKEQHFSYRSATTP